MTATLIKEKVWREVDRRGTWDHADIVRSGIIRDTPSVDVRLQFRDGQYVIEVSGTGKP
jgi:hypothetical protein